MTKTMMMIVLMMVQIKIDVAHYLSTIIEHDNSDDEDGDDANKKKMLFITHFVIPYLNSKYLMLNSAISFGLLLLN